MPKLFDLGKTLEKNRIVVNEDKTISRDIAVIGLSCLLPSAGGIDEFWEILKKGVDCVRKIPQTRLADIEKILQYYGVDSVECSEMAYLDEIDKFDYSFFGFSPKEASLIDPNQRLFLQAAWSCIEDAGYGNNKLSGSRTGVFVGYSGDGSYMKLISETQPQASSVAVTGNLPSILASRISYVMDLRGPSIVVDTACSSSLVAVHYACEAILRGECTAAIAGSVKLQLFPTKTGANLGITASDGRTRTFDDRSDGTGMGEGVIALLLKPVPKAIEDGDHIYAVIKGSSVNQDGTSVSLTAPNPLAQADVIARAWENAGINPETIGYIEAHGTGTKLGDPVEVEGIKRAFERYTGRQGFCAVGSVKTNLGHLDHAAGAAGLLKCILSLKHGQLLPLLHFKTANRNIDFMNSPVYINSRLAEWENGNGPRRCGVSSFGFSGTNCHMVLEEYSRNEYSIRDESGEIDVLTISAKSKEALLEFVERYIRFLKSGQKVSLHDVCYTANTGRGHYTYRIAILFKSAGDLLEKLGYLQENGFSEKMPQGVYYGNCRHRGAVDVSKELPVLGGKDLNLAEKLCQYYADGAEFSWEAFYSAQGRKRVSIPTYPFEGTRCWLDIPSRKTGEAKQEDTEPDMFYTAGWEYNALEPRGEEPDNGAVLVLMDECGMGGTISQRLREKGRDVIEVETGEGEVLITKERCRIPVSEEGFRKLFDALKERKISRILHLLTIKKEKSGPGSMEELEETQKKGVTTLVYLVKALGAYGQDIDLVLLSEYVNEVSGREKKLFPENATFFGFGKVMYLENPGIRCRCIDIDEHTGMESILDEILHGCQEYSVAYRRDERFVERIHKVPMDFIDNKEAAVKEGGIYVITGGAGRVGLEICRHLGAKGNVRIALIGRSGFPGREAWDGYGAGDELGRKIALFQEVEKNGSRVYYYQADITNEKELGNVLDDLRARFGRIDGIIHCAAVGVGKKGFEASGETDENLKRTLAPKVLGTWLLDTLTRKDELDFFIMFSSAITLMGGIGAGAYLAANSYLDSFAYKAKKSAKRVFTVNWPLWSETAAYTSGDDRQMFEPLTNRQAVSVFDKLLKKDISRVIAGRINYRSEVYLLEKHLPFRFSGKTRADILERRNILAPGHSNKIAQARLAGRSSNEYSLMEKKIGAVISQALGLEEININDSFAALGGNSIIAISVEAEMEKNNIPITIAELFKYETVKKMARHIEGEPSGTEEEPGPEKSVPAGNESQEPANGIYIDDIQPVNEVFYKNCFYNSLFPVILHYQQDLMQLLANDSIVYTYDAECNHPVKINAAYMPVQEEEKVLAGMGLVFKTKTGVENIMAAVKEALSLQHPVILWVDCFYAPIRKDAYQKKHQMHTWLIYGYDEAARVCHIIEHEKWEELSYKKKEISCGDLMNAYNGYISGSRQDENSPDFYAVSFEHKEVLKDTNAEAVFIKNILDNRELIRDKIALLEIFSRDLNFILSDESVLKENMVELFNRITNIVNIKRVEKYRINRLFAHEAELTALISDIVDLWDTARAKIGNYMYTSVYKYHRLNSVNEALSKIIENEYRFNEKLISVLLDNKGSKNK